ncbi:ATP-binding protein [Sphingobacterium sp. SGL-16]|uniref:ATP-binding response regulator n=1 Tax=Sphingobacterium sp. SGL-16 TaxID=2710883 RepID=UPI0013EC2CBF|nr:ATP-binding protein [Sphingobacterium sp. SGL-16]NGM73125.1 response regulator [Sphingobacterium sp. SGL-16]
MILIVDDKKENIYSLKTLLESKNFEVDTALSGEEALRKVLKRNYALIILDVQMPGMDGFEVAESLAGYSRTKDIPVIFLSANNTDKQFITKGYDSGGIDYITKPVDPEILLLKVRTFSRLYEQTQSLNEAQLRLQSEIESRKKAQEELKIQVEHLRSIMESLPQIAFSVDDSGKISYVNHNWLNYAPDGETLPIAHPDETDQLAYFLTHCNELNGPIEREIRIKELESGQYRYHLLRIIPIREDNKICNWIGTLTDINDQKLIESKKDEFLSIASHELKTPLTGIKAYVQLLERVIGKQDINISKTYIERAKDEVFKLESLIADLLDISKIENGQMKINKQEIDLEKTITNAIETIRETCCPNITIERQGEIFDKPVVADALRIEQVLVNFLTNAIKYAPESEKVLVKTSVKDKELCIAVQDFGIGIPIEKQKYIFSKFYRVEESSLKFQGLGIGLYICAEIIKQHQGNYGVESKVGEGSTIYFTLPYNQQNYA